VWPTGAEYTIVVRPFVLDVNSQMRPGHGKSDFSGPLFTFVDFKIWSFILLK
jgi:hypothetical protein